jgi:hypothetical protein
MPVTSQQLDGQNVVVTVEAPATSADLFAVDIVTGAVTSPWLTSVQLGNLRKAALAFFELVPLAERTSVAFLNRLASVTPFEDWQTTLSAVTTGTNEQTLRATPVTPLGDTHLAVTLPHSITGLVATGGIGSGAGGGGGGGGGESYDIGSFIRGYPGASQRAWFGAVRDYETAEIRLWCEDAPTGNVSFLFDFGGSSVFVTLPAGDTTLTQAFVATMLTGQSLTVTAPFAVDATLRNVWWSVKGAVL